MGCRRGREEISESFVLIKAKRYRYGLTLDLRKRTKYKYMLKF